MCGGGDWCEICLRVAYFWHHAVGGRLSERGMYYGLLDEHFFKVSGRIWVTIEGNIFSKKINKWSGWNKTGAENLRNQLTGMKVVPVLQSRQVQNRQLGQILKNIHFAGPILGRQDRLGF